MKLSRRPCLLALATAVAAVQALGAPAVRVERLACGEGVQVSSRGAPLSQVLQQMSTTLGFELKYWGNDDPPIDWDVRQRPMELMSLLSNRANLLVRYEPDRRCAGQSRIASVHVLPTGTAKAPPRPAPVVRASATAAARGAEAGHAPAPAAPGTARPRPAPAGGAAPAMAHQQDEAMQAYLRAHGMDPQPSASGPSAGSNPARP